MANIFEILSKNQIKLIKLLHRKEGRNRNGLFLAEGVKICEELLLSKIYEAQMIVIPSNAESEIISIANNFKSNGVATYRLQNKQFQGLCTTKTPQNIIAIVKTIKQNVLKNESFIALDGISDPGNVGTIIRTADWFGYKQIILGAKCADLYNPKVVRGTMGSIFHSVIIQTDDLPALISNNFPKHEIFGAGLETDKYINELRPAIKMGLVFGNEAVGISKEVNEIIDHKFLIPGRGQAESLNVAIAAGISLFHFAEGME